MKRLLFICFLFTVSVNSQEFIEATLVKKTDFTADVFVSTNNFETTFYVLDNVFFKNSKEIKGLDIGYSNFQLGNITSANTFNPLKINVFYRDFNTVLILDNRLAEIFKIDFNSQSNYKNISHISTGSDNTIWLFNQNTQQIELFDYKTNTTRAKTLPIQNTVIDLKSNFNFCWVLTEKQLYMYDYFGNLIKKIKNQGFTSIVIDNENIVLRKDNALFYLRKNTEIMIPINLPNLLINQFFVTNETLYIYDNEMLQQFQLKNL
jgi:hypothetical protein